MKKMFWGGARKVPASCLSNAFRANVFIVWFFCFDNNGCSLFKPHGMAMVNSNWKLFEYRVRTLTFKEFFWGRKCRTIWKIIYLLHFYWTVSHHFMGPPIHKSSSATARYTRLAGKMRFLYKYIKTKFWLVTCREVTLRSNSGQTKHWRTSTQIQYSHH